MTKYKPEDLLFFDETSKDNSALRRCAARGRTRTRAQPSRATNPVPRRRTEGYSIRGQPALSGETVGLKGLRVSSLAAFSGTGGFEDWRFTTGTYKTDNFLEALKQMVRATPRVAPIPHVSHRLLHRRVTSSSASGW